MNLFSHIKSFFQKPPCIFCNLIPGLKRINKRWKDRCAYFKQLKQDGKREKCDRLPLHVYKRADPTIYSQHYLHTLGYTITWNNPDIQMKKNGIPISSDNLEADTVYEIEARIWNGSNDAPAIGMPVDFSFVKFGIANISNPIGQTIVDLPVRGAPGHPAFTTIKWRTPPEPGHYCVRVDLIWNDDANPANNTGSENCNVGHFNSPTAKFQFNIKNDFPHKMTYNMVADAYEIPPAKTCPAVPEPPYKGRLKRDRIKARRAIYLKEHDVNNFPVPDGWKVNIHPQTLTIERGNEEVIEVTIISPDDDPTEEKTFNINAYTDGILMGGVTLTAKK